MKTSILLILLSLFSALLFVPSELGAGTLKKKEIRKFKGDYLGQVRGIAGKNGESNALFSFESEIKLTGKSRELVAPQISSLYASSAHRLVFRKPTGSKTRAKFVGYYVGTSPTLAPVSGIRRMTVSDRGKGKNVRFVMRFSDTLREDGYAAQDLSGVLGKAK
jgi:hypothetical protein